MPVSATHGNQTPAQCHIPQYQWCPDPKLAFAVINAEIQHQAKCRSHFSLPSRRAQREKGKFAVSKVAGRVHSTVRIRVPIQPAPVRSRRIPLLLPDAIVLRIEELIPLRRLLLRAPQPPRYERESANQNRAADAADDTTDDLLRVRRKVGPVAAAVREARRDCGSRIARCAGHDGIGGHERAVGLSVGGPEGCVDRLVGFLA